MPSKARKSFDANLKDIERLLKLHEQQGGTAPGRRFGLEVLNKSAIVLITSFWEAYCEDVAAEGLAHIVKNAKTADALPKELKKQLAAEIKKALDDLEIWKIADDHWRTYLESRLNTLQEQRDRKLNTPKAGNIDQLFLSAIGINKVSSSWYWAGMSTKQAQKKLDKYVTLRGAIAHRGQHQKGVKRSDVEDYQRFIMRLAGKTGRQVNRHVKSVTGKQLW